MDMKMVEAIQDRIEEDIEISLELDFKDMESIKKKHNKYFFINGDIILYRYDIHYYIKKNKDEFVSLTIKLYDIEIEWGLGLSVKTMDMLDEICKNVYEYEKSLEQEELNKKLEYIYNKIL